MIQEFENLKEVQMIIFRLGNEEYAVPITNVQEIIMPRTTTHIPKSPSWVEGVVNLRGHIIPIIDGKKKFFLEGTNQDITSSRIIVLDVEHEIIGLIVDEVSEVVHIKTEDIEPTPSDIEADADFLWGIGKHQDRLLILINPKKFLSFAEAHDLKQMAKITQSVQQSKQTAKSAV